MFGIGGGELIFIVIVALMLFGTDKIPEAARSFAKIMSQVKNASNDNKSEIQKSATENGLDNPIKQITSNFNNEVERVKNSVDVTRTEVTPEVQIPVINNEVKDVIEEPKVDIEEITGPIKRQR